VCYDSYMKNTPMYRVMIRHIESGDEWVPSRYTVGTKVYSQKAAAIAAIEKYNGKAYYRGITEAVLYETQTSWSEVPLDKSLDT
jgi:hypothetical protein